MSESEHSAQVELHPALTTYDTASIDQPNGSQATFNIVDAHMSLTDENGNFLHPNEVPPQKEDSQFLAHRLLVEFGKTRTNYSSLVPRVVEVMRIYRDYGAGQCPVPVVSNLADLLNDEALIRIEHRYPGSIDAGFLVLCTEKRALRSGGGGKYYFMDGSGRLVGCHKSDLGNYVVKGILKQGPVLLKNLIFVFIMRAAYGLDPRCKSSNPQRLLEFYENLAKQGKASDIQRLVRVWSMEVHPEPPYDYGFPHCALLWVKRMSIAAHVAKWKNSQWQTSQFRAQYAAPSGHPHHLGGMVYKPEGGLEMYTDAYLCNDRLPRRGKRRRMAEEADQQPLALYGQPYNPQFSTNVAQEQWHESYEDDPAQLLFPYNEVSWDADSVAAIYERFSDIAVLLEKQDMIDWSVVILERLNDSVLDAAMQLICSTFAMCSESADGRDSKELRYGILRKVCDTKEKDRMAEAVRILLACLVQQQRLLQIDSSHIQTEISGNEPSSAKQADLLDICTQFQRFETLHPLSSGLDQVYPTGWDPSTEETIPVEEQVAPSDIPQGSEEECYTLSNENHNTSNRLENPLPILYSVPTGPEVVVGQPAAEGTTDDLCYEIDIQELDENHYASPYGKDSEPSTSTSTSIPLSCQETSSVVVKREY